MVEQRIGAVILAAGEASRFGGDKLLAKYNGTPLVCFALRAAAVSSADPITLVLAPGTLDAYRPHINALGRTIHVVIPKWGSRGLAYSLRAGLDAMPDSVTGIVVLLADMPLVDFRLINSLIDAYRSTDYAVVPQHNGRRGNPILLGRASFVDLETLAGDDGAREFLRARANRVRRLAWDRRCLVDIDSQQELDRLRNAAILRDCS